MIHQIPGPLLVVTDRHGAERPLVETVRAVLGGGARWIWFRDRDMEPAARQALAVHLLELVRAAGGRLTIGGDPGLAAAIGADGVHLGGSGGAEPAIGANGPLAQRIAAARTTLGADALVGVSAHSVANIRVAAAAGADYATLSPIFPTASKPGYGPALGLGALREAAVIGLPVVALGGIGPAEARTCLEEVGAAGIAVMGGLMRARDPEAKTRRLLAALSRG